MEKPQNYLSRLRRHPLLWNLALIAAIILAMAVAAHILMQLGTRHGARRTVPDLSGVQLDQAQRIARKHDLQLHINDSLFVPAYEGGIVLDQLPEGGVEVKPGRTVYITINSFRQKMVPVPYVAGRSLRQAKNMLEIAGLEIAELVYRADMATNYVLEEYCEGKPVTPTTRMEAEMGSGVTLYVGVEEGYGTTIVPRLVGLPLAQAKGRLWELGLNVGRVDFDEGVNLLNQKDTRVYIQTPGAERSAALGSKVDLRLTLDARRNSPATGPRPRSRRPSPPRNAGPRSSSGPTRSPGRSWRRLRRNPPRSGPQTITRDFSTDDRQTPHRRSGAGRRSGRCGGRRRSGPLRTLCGDGRQGPDPHATGQVPDREDGALLAQPHSGGGRQREHPRQRQGGQVELQGQAARPHPDRDALPAARGGARRRGHSARHPLRGPMAAARGTNRPDW